MDYIGGGTILTGGCAGYDLTRNYAHRFDVSEIVYSKPKALIGIFRKHAIKEIRFYPDDFDLWGRRTCTICNYPPMYVDSFNAFHNEEDLLTYEEAAELVEAALIHKAAVLERSLRDFC